MEQNITKAKVKQQENPSVALPRTLKRVIDIIVSGVSLIILSPLFALFALAIKLTSPGPVFFRWHVVGESGRPLVAYKFRTMVVGADKMKADLLRYNEARGPVFKMKNDPRITQIGRILRKFSLDELPQLWSVLKGDMSLVGPRPVLPSEWERFSDWQRQKLRVKPGGISLWHVSGQPRDLDKWVELDLEYVENWSLLLDLKILLRGIIYILGGKNV